MRYGTLKRVGPAARLGSTRLKKTALLSLILVAAGSPAMASPHRTHRHSASIPAPSHINCGVIRDYVREVGLAQATAMARAAGMTASQERRARQCLAKKI